MNSFEDTIFAPATLPGSGAVSIVRISGPGSLGLVDSIVRFRHTDAASSKGYSLKFGTIEGLDDVLVSIFHAPHSYTGEDSAEISCHASPFIVSRILEMLSSAGGRLAQPGEFTRRAFLNGKMDLAQAEAVADVIASSNAAAHRVALNQLRGGYSTVMRELRERLLRLCSLLELELDFSEEDVEFADRRQLRDLLEECITSTDMLAASFRDGNAIRRGVPVAIVGAPNSGKSTLLNALLREDRAIVSDIPGTTRDTVEETVTIDGILFRFIDTAGIRQSSDHIEAMGIERSFAAVDKADIVLAVVDASSGSCCPSGTAVLDAVIPKLHEWQQLIVLNNKCDLLEARTSGTSADDKAATDRKGLYNEESAAACMKVPANPEAGGDGSMKVVPEAKMLDISAKFGTGIDDLRALLAESQGQRFSEAGTLVTNARHHSVLVEATKALRSALCALDSGLPTVLISEHLRAAITALGSITGEISTDEVLGQIFEKFCIGK